MATGERILDFDGTFFRGMKSDSDPGQTPLGYFWSGLNLINVGGVLSCRPGYRCIVQFPRGNLQGATIFRPLIGLEQLVVAIDGVIYTADWPFKDFRILPNVQMVAHAKQVFWALTIQSTHRVTTDIASALEVIPPRAVLFIQDGGLSAPAWYDGSNSGHVRDNNFETPSGGPMEWVGDRLWVGVDTKVFASDISNPFSFREQIYLGGVSAFFFSSQVTAMVKTPSIEAPQLVVFTSENTTLIQANIRNRNLWPTTDNFQEEILQIGCDSDRAALSHLGRIMWFSPSGVVWFDPATSGKITARLPMRDNEMLLSKSRLSGDLSLVAAGTYGQFLLMSVPHEDIYNKHTWVLNGASIETLTDDSGPAWCGYWMGTRPVEWIHGLIAGEERVYHVSTDEDGENRLWQCFIPDRKDNGCPITWAVETRGYFGQTAQVQKKLPGSDCKMGWVDLAMVGVEEDLDLGIFYAGGVRGAYKPILSKRLSIERGSLSFDQEITATSQLFAFKAQSRKVRSEDANQQSVEADTGSCSVESEKNENLDENFQVLVVGHGPATIRWIRVFGFTNPEDLSGEPQACLNEPSFNCIRFDGEGIETTDLGSAIEELGARVVRRYTANKTAILSAQEFTEVGVGFAESVVSQDAADRVAEIIATKMADSQLGLDLPLILSGGFESEPTP